MKKLLTAITAILCLGFAGTAMAADPAVENGKLVKLDYTLTVNNQEIETSIGKKPLEFVVGDKSVIPGLENGLTGMHRGEEKLITVESKDAYGQVDPKAFKEFPKTSMPKGAEPKVGMVLQAQAPDGESFPATIAELKGDKVILDFNHPLAGKQLKFQVKVLDITQAPPVQAKPLVPAADVKK
ncbi:MAG: peptidylprolyl isomerase [Candidatus Omnitrophica bacterium]|nr:peptidylprolyl isomerase [Candidatus Omnitrophota bacterium]